MKRIEIIISGAVEKEEVKKRKGMFESLFDAGKVGYRVDTFIDDEGEGGAMTTITLLDLYDEGIGMWKGVSLAQMTSWEHDVREWFGWTDNKYVFINIEAYF